MTWGTGEYMSVIVCITALQRARTACFYTSGEVHQELDIRITFNITSKKAGVRCIIQNPDWSYIDMNRQELYRQKHTRTEDVSLWYTSRQHPACLALV